MAWALVAAGAVVEVLCAVEVFPMRFWLVGQIALILGCTMHITRRVRDRHAAVVSAFEFGRESVVRSLRPPQR